MKLIIGLGNPGEKYKNNRHSVGHVFIEDLKSKIKDQSEDLRSKIKLLNSDCFMNESGKFVRRELRNLGIKELSQLYVVHDDLDISLGQYKIQFGTGPKVHYGIQSIERELGTKDFWRIRIGVDNRDPGSRMPGDKYVLENFRDDELAIVQSVFKQIDERLVKEIFDAKY